MEKNKIIITMGGGLITSVFCNDKNSSVLVVDFDKELDIDPDEIIEDKEIEKYAGEEVFYSVDDYKSGVSGSDSIPVYIND